MHLVLSATKWHLKYSQNYTLKQQVLIIMLQAQQNFNNYITVSKRNFDNN